VTTSSQVSLAAQATAVRRAAVQGGHINNLQSLVARKQRPDLELEIAQSWLPALAAAADTMENLARTERSAS
jgi:hypothetical protein